MKQKIITFELFSLAEDDFKKRLRQKKTYFTSIKFDRNLKVDGSLILPLSFHQRSILRVFKGS